MFSTRKRLFLSAFTLTGILAVILSLTVTVPAQQPAKPAPQAKANQPSPAKETPKADRLKAARTEIQAAKSDLMKDGKYKCCVAPACDWCLLTEEGCGCMANLRAGKEVCPGCGLGWHNDKGAMKGIDKKNVKWNITHSHVDGHKEESKEKEHKH